MHGRVARLGDGFMVIATQNPIEQEGTYLLPEAQLDRFLFKVVIGYPTRDEERDVVRRHDERFLRELYAAQRAHLEQKLLFGKRREDKFSK